VAVTVTSSCLRAARRDGFTGTAQVVLRAAAVAVGRQVADAMATRGFTVGELLTPAEIGRLIVDAGDPFAVRATRTVRERLGAPERTGPDSVDASTRTHVAIDGAVHRVFALEWPRVPVDADWLWKPLDAAGPKIVTCVFEPVSPWVADRRREVLRSRAGANNAIDAARRGRVRAVDQRKVDALRAADQAVADGHQDLVGWALVVVSARTVDELTERCSHLRDRFHASGRTRLRDLHGLHDLGWAAALPLGVHVGDTIE
jgi:hypothetical protein